MTSPYAGKQISEWLKITEDLISKHPFSEKEIVDVVLKSWDDIFNSKIGSFYIGKDIFPTPQIMSFFLHELVAHYLSLANTGIYKVGVLKHEKDIHHLNNDQLSVEIKGSSHNSQIFGNRSYGQPNSGKGQKDKNGYYITINFQSFANAKGSRPKIILIRFGYLEHTDWIAQTSETGQQARLKAEVYQYKLKVLYKASKSSITSFPHILGKHNNFNIAVSENQHGYYIQLLDGKTQKASKIPNELSPYTITLEEAIQLLNN